MGEMASPEKLCPVEALATAPAKGIRVGKTQKLPSPLEPQECVQLC